jgi:hypothetical protein
MKNPHDYSTGKTAALVVRMLPSVANSPVFGLSSNIPKTWRFPAIYRFLLEASLTGA